jgi:tRNA pseudouridine55 synthase
VYRATVRLGFATTTDDLLGEPQGDPRPVAVSAPAVAEAARSLTGPIDQVPPSYSAKRVGGRRLYELAREGFAPLAGAVRVTVHAFDVIGVEGDRVEIEVCCSPGTYVRALARDLGQALGVGAHLLALRRLRTGSFGLEHAVDGDGLTAEHRESVLSLGRLLPDLPAVHVSGPGRRALQHGRDLDRSLVGSEFPDRPAPRWRVLDETGDLLALAVPRGFGQEGSGLPSRPVLHPDLVLVD